MRAAGGAGAEHMTCSDCKQDDFAEDELDECARCSALLCEACNQRVSCGESRCKACRRKAPKRAGWAPGMRP